MSTFDREQFDEATREEWLKPAEQLACDHGHAFVDFDHLLLVDLRNPNSLLAPLWKAGERQPRLALTEFSARIEQHLAERVPRGVTEGPAYSPELAEICRILGEREKNAHNLQDVVAVVSSRPANTPLHRADLLAAILDYRPHRLVPLLSQTAGLDSGFISRQRVAVPAHGGSRSTTASPLDTYGVDFTDLAAAGRIGEVIGRENEISRLSVILGRREANNALLVGDPGVGKTRIVEGLALRLHQKQGPRRLQGKRIVALDLAALVAGTVYRGEFEERLNGVLRELSQARGEILLFIDEIHQLLGLGRTTGSSDAANLMKPALARGELWCIGATTYPEYRQFERDPAFRRRFQVIALEEQRGDEVEQILRRAVVPLETHHGVRYTEETLRQTVILGRRYVGEPSSPARELGLLDEVGAELATSGEAVPEVTPAHVAALLSRQTGVPIERLTADRKQRLAALPQRLAARVFGQPAALHRVVQGIRRASAGLAHPERPRALYLFAGPSGVGKTELARALAEELFDSPTSFVRLDMSEFAADTARNRLIGSDPGFVGYEEGGRLTEAIRRRPYSLLLLDEFEKAHPEVWRLFLQVFDAGRLTDASGRTVRFAETVIVLTSNAGAGALAGLPELAARVAQDPASAERPELWHSFPNLDARSLGLLQHVAPDLLRGAALDEAAQEIVCRALLDLPWFPPELLGRLGRPLVFQALTAESLVRILAVHLRDACERIALHQEVHLPAESTARRAWIDVRSRDDGGLESICLCPVRQEPVVKLTLDGELCRGLLQRGSHPLLGARALRNVFEQEVETALADRLLELREQTNIDIELSGLKGDDDGKYLGRSGSGQAPSAFNEPGIAST